MAQRDIRRSATLDGRGHRGIGFFVHTLFPS
jgi:hypothetical protein